VNETLKASLPPDLFNPERLPPRREDGMVWHPDYDLIYSGLGIDDEGHAAWEFMKELGLEFAGIEMNEELYEQYEQDVTTIAFWTPEKPDGNGWQLLSIDIGEDGPVAWYSRAKPENVNLTNILEEITTERARQDGKWGGAQHDDQHSTTEFVGFIQDYAGWARRMDQMGSPDKARRRLIQVAALAVAAVESIDRKTLKEQV